ncbi:RelB/DinJ family addiction module antitoxin [Weissella muntiaci]|uniref:RelB/DinJ family addiction module antitoxin n=1 Tax=Weissella muntiaci TaxID=2508881 RepID=A0A6C2C2G1_9LACO|nr:type II toxin-antitoxin system RelB/DinJ family antitoxin [Weissella muntiaci]TYC47997.1 RelB/DinJ family addiction module antitoxin [Weissella muntiaci]
MVDKLIQIRVKQDVKQKVDELFERNGITTQVAIQMFIMQVANTEKTPFDDLF